MAVQGLIWMPAQWSQVVPLCNLSLFHSKEVLSLFFFFVIIWKRKQQQQHKVHTVVFLFFFCHRFCYPVCNSIGIVWKKIDLGKDSFPFSATGSVTLWRHYGVLCLEGATSQGRWPACALWSNKSPHSHWWDNVMGHVFIFVWLRLGDFN